MSDDIYYVYIHARADCGEPFYIGMGQGGRAWKKNKSSRSKEWMEVYSNHGVDVIIYEDSLSAKDAMDIEIELIADYRDAGCDLVNKASGGQYGSNGAVRSAATRMKLRDINGGHPVYCSNGMVFDSIKASERWLRSIGFDKASSSSVSSACKGGVLTAYGFSWSKTGVPDMPEIYGADLSRVKNLEMNAKRVRNSMGERFITIKQAAIEMARRHGRTVDSANASIKSALKGRSKSSFSMEWKYD